MLEYEGIQITWLGHDGFKLKKGRVVYVDPHQLGPKAEPADLVFVTHEHFDTFWESAGCGSIMPATPTRSRRWPRPTGWTWRSCRSAEPMS